MNKENIMFQEGGASGHKLRKTNRVIADSHQRKTDLKIWQFNVASKISWQSFPRLFLGGYKKKQIQSLLQQNTNNIGQKDNIQKEI